MGLYEKTAKSKRNLYFSDDKTPGKKEIPKPIKPKESKPKEKPAKTIPVKATPVKVTPVKVTPVKATPVKATPTETTVAKTTHGNEMIDDQPAFNPKLIKQQLQKQIKKEESKLVREPTTQFAVQTGRMQLQRPRGALNQMKSGGGLDMSAIKASLQKRLHREHELVPKKSKYEDPDRITTGIAGLDGVMEGGLRPISVNLVGGGAGSGKSVFSMQFLVQGVNEGQPGVYITFEQTAEELLTDVKRFGWDLEKKIKDRKLAIIHYTPEQVQNVLEAGGGTVRDTIESMGARRLVLDSLTAFTLLHESEMDQRREAFELFEAIRKWQCTSLVISEQEPDPERHHSDIMEFQVDGVILLYNIRKGDIRERSLEIFKMRGVDHARKIFPMKITSKGMQIYPEETVF